MKIIICGAGQVGGQIARHLAREEGANHVTVIDIDAALVRRLTDAYDVNGIVGFASHPDILERAGARDADMMIAATQSDEVNMVVCQVANSIFSVPRKIARLRAPAYLNAIYSDLYRQRPPADRRGHLAGVRRRRRGDAAAWPRRPPSTSRASSTARRSSSASRSTAPAPVLNTPLRQLSELFSTLRAVVVGVRRGERLFVPEAERPALRRATRSTSSPPPRTCRGSWRSSARPHLDGRAHADRRRRQHRPARRADARGRRPQAPPEDHRAEPRPRRGGRRRAEAHRGAERRRPRPRAARGGERRQRWTRCWR